MGGTIDQARRNQAESPMTKTAIMTATFFVLIHIAIVAPFVAVTAIPTASLGLLAMSSMALTLVLAARWRIVDRVMGGPDKSYAMHRWLGFFALGGTLGHWAIASSGGTSLVPFLADGAEGLGTAAAFGLLTLSAAAMVRAIPYHLWKASHMLMGPIFVAGVLHTFLVASPLAVGSVPWLVLAALSVVGLLGWGQTLKRKMDPTRLVTVDSVTPFEGGVDVIVRAEKPLPAFNPGQFATIAHNQARAEAHPFTIAGGDETTRRFVIRSAGDWTADFVKTVKPGDQLRLGRGVGRFLPQTDAARSEQLWVAGGVGVTPFLAALEKMQPDDGAKVTMVFCIRSRASAGVLADVEAHARRLPQVDLMVLADENGERLTKTRLADAMRPMAKTAQIYLCGPEGLKDMVTQVAAHLGHNRRIHSERFDFRGAFGLTDLIYIGKSVLDAARMTGKTHAPSRP